MLIEKIERIIFGTHPRNLLAENIFLPLSPLDQNTPLIKKPLSGLSPS
jgi:hypothetical protein